GPGRDDLSALEEHLHARVVLVLLESLERRKSRVAVIEPDDVADIHAVVVEVIEEAAGVGVRVRRPSKTVLDAPRAPAPGGQLPKFFVAEREGLRAVPAGEIETGDELLRDRAPRAFRQHRERCMDLHSGREIRTRLAVATPPHVADAHAL